MLLFKKPNSFININICYDILQKIIRFSKKIHMLTFGYIYHMIAYIYILRNIYYVIYIIYL